MGQIIKSPASITTMQFANLRDVS